MVRLKKTNSVFWVTASKTEGRKTEGKTEGLLRFYQKTEGIRGRLRMSEVRKTEPPKTESPKTKSLID